MYNNEKELRDFELENQILIKKNELYQSQISDSLINGNMGCDIKNTLNKLKKPSKFKLFKLRITSLFKTIFNAL